MLRTVGAGSKPGLARLAFLALVIVQPTKCGVLRLVAAFRTMRRRVAALHKLTHWAER